MWILRSFSPADKVLEVLGGLEHCDHFGMLEGVHEWLEGVFGPSLRIDVDVSSVTRRVFLFFPIDEAATSSSTLLCHQVVKADFMFLPIFVLDLDGVFDFVGGIFGLLHEIVQPVSNGRLPMLLSFQIVVGVPDLRDHLGVWSRNTRSGFAACS